ncbi:hypothetical protein LWI28_025704 [Acer negundo]|uniref:CCHC-type domain-containing protein n=1 Tax=Acer negundo TaxID=4023 RepID=A0AAD5J330_ACENE|nr:hypothetical protein LWI28_025704 [Acer negundo]KAK4849406.1 hypothetical protein QYF36_024425 [Acer negundo]
MGPASRQIMEQMVIEILKEADMEQITEFKVRTMASERLGIDLSDTDHKKFIRGVVESFLLSTVEKTGDVKEADSNVQGETRDQLVNIKKEANHQEGRVICQLSDKRRVVIHELWGKTLVSIRDFYQKDGKQLPSATGISLARDQWGNFRKSVPAIEEAIKKMQAKIRSEVEDEENGVVSDSVTSPTEFVPTEPERFNGKNYLYWAQKMEVFLKQLKIEYVLSDACPGVTLSPQASSEEISKVKVAEQKWVHDDHICRRHILSCLSDHLYYQFSKKTKSAKELWEELKFVYLYEEFGTKRLQVKKYIEFQMVDEKPILEQLQEFNNIADSVVASGMMIDDNFHVSVIISKLPPSWKDFCIKLTREEYLSFGMLMDRITVEEGVEGLRHQNKQGELSNSVDSRLAKDFGPRMREMKRPGMSWKRRDSEMDGRIIVCYNCGRKGHMTKDCWNRKFDKEISSKQIGNRSTTPGGDE